MKNYLLIITLSISLLGCRAKKVVVSEKSETTTAITLSEIKTTERQELSLMVENIFSTAMLSEDIEVIQTSTVYSAPDSLGRQFTREQTETRLTNRKEVQLQNQSITKTVVDTRDTTSQSINQSISQSANQSQSITETPCGQAWRSWVAIIISLGIVIIAYLILRRFGLIKRIRPGANPRA